MTQANDQLVRQMVEQVLQHLRTGWGDRATPSQQGAVGRTAPIAKQNTGTANLPTPKGKLGQFADVNDAVAAASAAYRALSRRSLAQREQICQIIRDICTRQADELGRLEFEETKIGHAAHKPIKLVLAAQVAKGVDQLRTECFSGDHGITLEEHAPWGVLGVLTPVTHSLPTMAVNAVQMIAAGNSLVVNPHPGGKRIAAFGAKLFNQAIYDALGIDNLICVITEPTLESAEQIFHHRDVRLLCITGGPGAVAAAMKSGKRAICAGPGNPPVVVDASANIDNAARCIIEGTSFDNNLLCLSEKEAFVEASVFDPLMAAMQAAGAVKLSSQQMDRLAEICIEPAKDAHTHLVARRKFVGAEPQFIAREIGLSIPADCRLLFGPTGPDHAFVHCEQMMPVLPVVRSDSFEQAV